MAILSPAEMVVWLEQNQFLTPTQMTAVRTLAATFSDTQTLANELGRRGWLTPFQIDHIVQGNHDQLVISKYRLRERIGDGAMGHVYKAWNPLLRQVVALKTIHKDRINNATTKNRFSREMYAAAQLKHPNIAFVLNADEDNGQPFLVMEYIDGINLSARVKKQGAMPIAEAVDCTRQAALGLQHAFERGIVHRDIKPANLMLIANKNGADSPLVKILDFGLARYESEEESAARLTQIGNLLGTVDYIAPEQAQNASGADIRADIYSLGCTLFYLLTANPPFQGDNVIEKLGPRITGEAPWVRTLNPDVPPGLEAIVRKMMARLPDDRYQTPIEAAEALAPYAGEPAAETERVVMAAPVEADAGAAMADPIMAEPIGEADDAVKPKRGRPHARLPMQWLMALGAGFMVLLIGCLGMCLFLWTPAKPVKHASIVISHSTKLSTPSQTVQPGETKRILVYIERVNFEGPVTISLDRLPAGVVGRTKVIPANQNREEVSFTVSYGTEPIATRIRVAAVCEAESAFGELMLPFTIVAEKKASRAP